MYVNSNHFSVLLLNSVYFHSTSYGQGDLKTLILPTPSSYIVIPRLALQYEDMQPYFLGQKLLIPRNSDLRFVHVFTYMHMSDHMREKNGT